MIFRKKKKKDKDVGVISAQSVVVKIYRDMGSNVGALIGTFEGTEKKDSSGNMVIENKAYNFLEDVDFEREEVFKDLSIILEIGNKTKEESLALLTKKITKQKKRLNYIDKFVQLNGIFNYPDEKKYLKDLTIMYKNIENITDGAGSFFTFENGKRVYSFNRKDGMYHPKWHGADNNTAYPDYTRKHKIKNSEDEEFQEEFFQFIKRNAQPAALLMLIIIFVGMIILTGYTWFQLTEKSNSLDRQAQASSMECVKQHDRVFEKFGKIMEVEVLARAINRSLIDDEPPVNAEEKEKISMLDKVVGLGK